ASGRHPVNLFHLVAGLVLLGLVGIWGLVEADVVGFDDTRWLLPLPWLLAGLVGVAVVTSANRRNRPQDPAPTTDSEEPR
ncbi:hypothetical protein, partial [Nocardioides sp.]|uniref:hypothetical protein n=1 Tax=Nocardioides sp. TaxID=35761 RepID=UPI00356928F8